MQRWINRTQDHSLEKQIQAPLVIEIRKVCQGSKSQIRVEMTLLKVEFRRIKLTAQTGKHRQSKNQIRCAKIAKMWRKCMISSWEVQAMWMKHQQKENIRECMAEAMAPAAFCATMMRVSAKVRRLKRWQRLFTTLPSISKSAIDASFVIRTEFQLLKCTKSPSSNVTLVKHVIRLKKTPSQCTKMSTTWLGKLRLMTTFSVRRTSLVVNSRSHSTMTMLQTWIGINLQKIGNKTYIALISWRGILWDRLLTSSCLVRTITRLSLPM